MNNIALKLQDIGVPAHVVGYEYLKSALSICMDNPAAIRAMTTGLYPAIAKTHDATPKCVERGIRTAIGCGWRRCPADILVKAFGPVVGTRKTCPTNSEFIAALAEQLRMEVDRS